MSGDVVAVLARCVTGYLTLAAFLCLVLSAELAFPRGRIIDRQARLRAISFVMIYIPVGVVVAHLTWRLVKWLDIGPLLPFAVGAIAGAVVGDFFYYWYHRAQHSFPWLWKYHAVHHSVEELGAGAGYHHLMEAPLKAIFVAIPVMLLIDKSDGALVVFAVSMHGYYIHSNTRLNFGPLARLVADNRVHRIHHSLAPRHFNKNFGAFTLIWDWLFGTAYFPAKAEWPAVGLRERSEPKTIFEYVVGRSHSAIQAYDGPGDKVSAGKGDIHPINS